MFLLSLLLLTDPAVEKMTVKELAVVLKDPKHPDFTAALAALAEKDADALPAFRTLLRPFAFDGMELEAKKALLKQVRAKAGEHIARLLESDDAKVRVKALMQVEQWRQPCPEAMPALIKLVRSEEVPAHVSWAAIALSYNKGEAKEAVPFLLKHLETPDTFSNDDAIFNIGLDVKLVPDVLKQVAAVKKPTDGLAIRYGTVLAGSGAAGLPAVTDALSHEQSLVRQAACRALTRIGKPAKSADAEKALDALLGKDDTRPLAASALLAIGCRVKKEAFPLLVSDLRHGRMQPLHVGERFEAAAVAPLLQLPDAAPALLDGLDDKNEMVRKGSLHVLRYMARQDPSAAWVAKLAKYDTKK